MHYLSIPDMKVGNLVVFRGPGEQLEMRSGTLESLNEGELLVRNKFTTICGSDLHSFSGARKVPVPSVLGHEIVGEILEIGAAHPGHDYNGEKISKGDIITWSIFSSDPTCAQSLAGIPQKGEGLFKYGHAVVEENDAFHGGLAEYCVLKPGTAILKIPRDLPLPIAATINCSISTVAGALRLAGDIRNKNIYIFGMGMLGITCAAMCRDAGAKWIGGTDISDKRLALARQFGADEVFDANTNLREIRKQLPSNGIDIAFDMSGAPDAMETSIAILNVGGTAVWVGAVFNTRKVKLDPEAIIRNLITIKGLHNYNFQDFAYAVDFIRRNWQRYPFDGVVEKQFDLSDAQSAFEYAIEHKPLRVGIRINSTSVQ
jgi:alcohol dehydrogenase